MTIEQDPFGVAYRSGRLSDTETTQRMLRTAVARVNHEGLRVSFDLLRFEDLIAEARVSRSAVYRVWPTKHHFYASLLLELAGHQHPAIAAYDENTVNIVRSKALEHLDHLMTPHGRRFLVAELCREGAYQNYATLLNTTAWSVYVTLNATLVGLPDTTLRSDLRRGLEKSEQGFLEKMSLFYATMIQVLGYRLRPALPGITLSTVAQLGAAVVEGLALNTVAMPDLEHVRFPADPFNVGVVSDWSMPGLGFASIVFNLVEPDPERDGSWDESDLMRCAELLQALDGAQIGSDALANPTTD